ncbi:hypothetical protein I7X12_08850 [Halosimplex litoreum]|uniref:Membrane domain of glycerophosphoryl diester phosphodiesterase n=1 Tax=Halosimplex litoreum TaxID=1198301 RepID=A0A7U3WAQ0_9EURY|nr:hypothetical protein [Halosimplex litoreum]QPV64695.1 hypothetical protein I7X12_08850 [Halosimplex litoreum]
MTLAALDRLDDAYRATGAFLRPVDRSRWLRLALIGLFVGLPTAAGSGVQWSTPASDPAPTPGGPVDVSPVVWIAVAAAVVVAVALALAFTLVGSVMEFVLYESLRRESVRVRAYWRRHFGRGVRLFGFRLAVGLAVLLTVALLVGAVVLSLAAAGDAATLVLVVVAVPVALVVALVAGVVGSFTTAFVVPVMLAEDRGVLAGWRRFWPTLTREWREFLVYAILAFVLGTVGAAAVGVVVALLAAVLLLPTAVLAAPAFALFLLAEPLGIAAFVVVGLVYVLAVVAVAAVVQVPVFVYLRYYALLVLGDANEAFDLIPEQRAAASD